MSKPFLAAIFCGLHLSLLLSCGGGFANPGFPPQSSGPPASQEDSPSQGKMGTVTAGKILTFLSYQDGWEITGLKSAAELQSYLSLGTVQSISFTSAAVPVNYQPPSETFTWIINSIGGKPVLKIGDRAFSPPDGDNDISKRINTIQLPVTIAELGGSLFAGTAQSLILDIPNTAPLVAHAADEAKYTSILVSAAEGSDATVRISDPAAPGESPVIIVRGPPVLLQGPDLDYTNGPAAVTYIFDTEVTASGLADNWSIGDQSAPSKTIKLVYTGSDEADPVELVLTAAATLNGVTKRTTAPAVTVMPVKGAFKRPAGGYCLAYYDPEYRVVRLTLTATSSKWYYVREADSDLRVLFNAVYTPNAAEPRNQAPISAVLDLFTITLGLSPSDTEIEIRGTALPSAAVIHIGTAEGDNSGLPVFTIRDGGLGTAGLDYAGVIFRVNRGAELHIKDRASAGHLKNSTMEIMGGGRLRDRAFAGFLGAGARVYARLGSSLAIGPKSKFISMNDYSGWLICPPSANDGAIIWGAGDQSGGHIEFYQTAAGDYRMAFSADITVRKSLALGCGVWFDGSPALTIDAADSLNDGRGLFAALPAPKPGYKFYGYAFQAGGENPADVGAKIIVRKGSRISRSFLDGGAGFIDGDVEISNTHSKGGAKLEEYGKGGIAGYFNWNVK